MKKIIALDLDGVVFDSENLYRIYNEIYDVDVMKGDNLIDNTNRLFQKRYNWSKEISAKFYQDNYKKVIQEANIMTGTDIVIKKLSKDYEFIIVTARSDEEIMLGMPKLKQLGLDKIKIINNAKDKIEFLKKENVFAIIDDEITNCRRASENGIVGIFFRNAASNFYKNEPNFVVVNNWGEIYKYLKLKG